MLERAVRDVFWRDLAIAGLILILAMLTLAFATYAFPDYKNVFFPIGGSLTGAATGLLSAAFAQKRTAQYFYDALSMAKLRNINIRESQDADAKYRYLYWKTTKKTKEGNVSPIAWYHCDIQWQRFGDLPFFTGSSEVSDRDDGEGTLRKYEHLMFRTRGRYVLLTSSVGGDEPTAVHIFWNPTQGDTLIGHLRHVTWVGKEALSPCVLSEQRRHSPQAKTVTPANQKELDVLWDATKADLIQDNLPLHS